ASSFVTARGSSDTQRGSRLPRWSLSSNGLRSIARRDERREPLHVIEALHLETRVPRHVARPYVDEAPREDDARHARPARSRAKSIVSHEIELEIEEIAGRPRGDPHVGEARAYVAMDAHVCDRAQINLRNTVRG